MAKYEVQYAGNRVGKVAKRLVNPFLRFMEVEASSGVLLLVITFVALFLANSALADWYFSFIKTPVSIAIGSFVLEKNFLLLVNDGLMAIFFYLVGLEIKREILVGELSTPKKASFSIFAAMGGMVCPALIYISMNMDTDYLQGWGVPMATDIAFAVGVLTLLGKRVPASLKIFLLALAIVDDLGAILVIALFYTQEIATAYLGTAGLSLFALFLLNYSGVRHIAFGLALGFITWFCFLKSGVHATIAGVILAFLTPARPVQNSEDSELLIDHYIHQLHPWVAYLIMPLFAFFNAGVSFEGIGLAEVMGSSVAMGIAFGLLFGKTIGIFLFTFFAVKSKVATLPQGVSWPQVAAVGCLAGIGFTMSLFIASLAFTGDAVESYSKIGILLGSAVAMILGLLGLLFTLRSGSRTAPVS